MSTYAVFGMTRAKARDTAKKRVKNVRKVNGLWAQIPESEWLELVDKETDRLMSSGHSIQLSDKFDAPRFAKEYLALARNTDHQNLGIKAYCDSGEKTKGGRRKMHWVDVDIHTGLPLETA